MAAPILVTAAGLGIAWVALNRERAKMPGNQSVNGAPTAGDAPATGADGIQAAADANGATPIGSNNPAFSPGPMVSTGPTIEPGLDIPGDQSTGGSDPSTQPSNPASDPVEGPTVAKTFEAPAIHATAIKFGSDRGITRLQRAAALAEIGPMAGMVW